jgi:hypothetical protein
MNERAEAYFGYPEFVTDGESSRVSSAVAWLSICSLEPERI